MKAFTEYLASKKFTKSGIASRLTMIKLYLKWLKEAQLEATEIGYIDLLLYMKYCGNRGASQKTIQQYIGTIKHYYDYLKAAKEIKANPVVGIEVKGIKRKTLYHILEVEELHKLYEAHQINQRHQPINQRNKVMVGLLVYQGLNTKELAQLEVKDIDLQAAKVTIYGGIKSNGRAITLKANQLMDLYHYIETAREKLLQMKPKRKTQIRTATDKLIVVAGGNYQNFGNLMTRLMIKLSKQNKSVLNAKQACLSVRQIRASVITHWLKQYNLREVQYLAGHRYISSTESYFENDLEGLQEEVNLYHPLDYEA